MNVDRVVASLLAVGLLGACAPTFKTVNLRTDARLSGGSEAFIRAEVPGAWSQSVRKVNRADFTVSDNFSSMSLTAQPVVADMARCPEFAKRAATDLIGKGQAEFAATSSPDVVDWTLTVEASPPGPSNKYIQGRAMCRNGALAVLTCTTGVNQKDEGGVACAKVLASLSVENTPAAPASAATDAPAAGAPVAASPLAEPSTPNMNDRRWQNALEMADKDLGAPRDQWKFEYAGDNRYVFTAGAKAVEYILFCSYGNCVWSSDLLSRAQFELGCQEALKVTVLGEAGRGVEGCGKKATYTFNPINKAWEGGK